MNIILVEKDDFLSDSRVQLTDRRHQHILNIHQAHAGDRLKVGLINGDIGQGTVISIDLLQVTLDINLHSTPAPALPTTLLLALPRPKMFKRILQTISSMGVKELYLINSYRVDKSYWSSPLLSEAAIREQLILGLEQAVDTHLPKVHLRKRFKPFVEDELPSICKNHQYNWVAHPYHAQPCPPSSNEKTLIAIGPEGGFIPYEIEKFNTAGISSIHLGERILKVETAVPAILSRLFPIA